MSNPRENESPQTQVALAQISESALPEELQDGKSGDRVSVVRAGVLYVRDGLASFAPWDTIYGVTELDGRLHILVPRKPPLAPWFTVHASMVYGGASALPGLAERVRHGRPHGGYRGAVRVHRARLSLDELIQKVRARESLAGGLTVPGSRLTSPMTQSLGAFQLVTAGGGALGAYLFLVSFLSVSGGHLPAMLLGMFGALLLLALGFGLAAVARPLLRRFEAILPVRRVIVLTPDGCVVGFPSGIRALRWEEVERFRVEPAGRGELLAVYGVGGVRLGAVHARFLAGPVRLIAAVATTYRAAAIG